jgi:hypothetical protein
MNTKKSKKKTQTKKLMWVAISFGLALVGGALNYACFIYGNNVLMCIIAIATLLVVGISIYAFCRDRANFGYLVGAIAFVVETAVGINSMKTKQEEPIIQVEQIELEESDGNTIIQNNSGKVEINQSKEENNQKEK